MNSLENVSMEHDVADSHLGVIPKWNAQYSGNSLAKFGATVTMRVIPDEGYP
ncbi:hypothetical protein AB3X91_21455 [Paraburkholderia sp. BR14263]|uniref:hypothetical protein n=1 Tax=unclassified Paraburkholderia TaxID=2615204 RepID=UPI0034CF00ED